MLISKRHKRAALKVKVTKRISDISTDDWNRIFPNVLESYDFFKTLDESNINQFSMLYLMVYDRKEPVGATTCFLMDYSLDTSINGPLRRVTNSIKKSLPNIFSLKVLVCGIPMTTGNIGVAGEADSVMTAILRRMEHMARKKKASIVAFKDFKGTYTGVLDTLRRKGFYKFDSLPSTSLDVTFKDFEEYLKTLSGASRYDLRRKFRKVDGHAAIDTEIVETLDGDTLKDVHRLYLGMVERHEMRFEVLSADFFKNISKNMPGRVKYFLWRIDKKLAAFVLCLVSEDELLDYYLGLDYSIAYKYHLYFIKFRDVLNWCIKHNIKRYDMGNTGYEPKLRLGFELVPLYLYVKLRNRMFRPFFNLICQFLKFEHFDPVLKKAKKRKTQ